MQNKLLFVFKAVPMDRQATLQAVETALNACLYVDDPEFSLKIYYSEWIEDLQSTTDREYQRRKSKDKITLALAIDPESPSKDPVGVCIKTRNQFSLFVKPSYRRLGIGSSLLELMRRLYGDRKALAFEGNEASVPFFKKNLLTHITYKDARMSIFSHYRGGKPAVD